MPILIFDKQCGILFYIYFTKQCLGDNCVSFLNKMEIDSYSTDLKGKTFYAERISIKIQEEKLLTTK